MRSVYFSGLPIHHNWVWQSPSGLASNCVMQSGQHRPESTNNISPKPCVSMVFTKRCHWVSILMWVISWQSITFLNPWLKILICIIWYSRKEIVKGNYETTLYHHMTHHSLDLISYYDIKRKFQGKQKYCCHRNIDILQMKHPLAL